MSRVRCPGVPRRRMAGLSLIEMMIALVMALIVAAGIISVFASTSSSNKVQAQMATLQEAGRFAIQSLRSDLANANGGYCSNSGGTASSTGSGIFLDGLRSPTIYAKNFTTINDAFADNTTPLVAPASPEAFSLPSRMFMHGYDCGTSSSTCKPVDPSTVTGVTIPAMGAAVGNRVPGTDVLTVRYLKPGSGWAISATGSTIDAASDGTVNSITLNPLPGEASSTGFPAGNGLAMLADCSGAQVFTVNDSGGKLTPNDNYSSPSDISKGAAPRIFDFSTDFQTVTYYLKVVCANGSTPCTGTTTGELERRVNGVDQPLVRGVERLDFRYGVIDGSGLTRFLTANEVDTATDADGNPLACHLMPDGTSDVAVPGGMTDTGCLWRAVQTIEVHILMDGQTPLYTLTPAEMNYIYTPDGDTSPQPPTKSGRGAQPVAQGFPNQLLRREFTTVVALRNFNP